MAVGLKTHIWNNALKCGLLLAAFPLLILLITYGFALLATALEDPDLVTGLRDALTLTPQLLPIAIGASLIWYVIAWFAHQKIIAAATGARRVAAGDERRLRIMLEKLAISRGLTTPDLRIIETPALNAYASGIRDGQYAVTVTRGLIERLDDDEMEAVLGHELTHIINGDVRLLVVTTVFVGIVSLAGDLLLRIFSFGGRTGTAGGWRWGRSSSGGSSRSSGGGRSGGGGGAAIFLILIAVAIFILARLVAIALRFALSRGREFMADAGAVELTKNPDAMIRALRKIEGRSDIAGVPSEMRAMFFDNMGATKFAGLFATHPPIADRVAALVRYAGGHDPGPIPDEPPPEEVAPPAEAEDAPAELPHPIPQPPVPLPPSPWPSPRRGPWG